MECIYVCMYVLLVKLHNRTLDIKGAHKSASDPTQQIQIKNM
jgi:hypothetical protein